MPSKSPAQANLMRAVAHGWKPDRIKGPSRAVAREFVNADRKYSGGFAENRYNTGGLAAMNEINSGVPVTLSFQEGGGVPDVPDYWSQWTPDDYVTGEAALEQGLNATTAGNLPVSTAGWNTSGRAWWMFNRPAIEGLRQQGYWEDPETRVWYPPRPTVTGSETPEPRVIPGAVGQPPAGSPFGGNAPPPGVVNAAPPWTPERAEQTAARRQSPYRDQLRAHKERVVAALNPAPQVEGAKGGYMNYQAGGEATPRKPRTGGGAPIPGHQEGTNPERPGSALYRLWESTFHIDPPPPPPPEPVEEPAWWETLFGIGAASDLKSRTEKELDELGEARGGYMRRYQVGGLAQAQGRGGRGFRPPRGGVPPSMRGLPPRAGGIPPRMAPSAAAPGQVHAGGSPGFYAPGGPGRGGGAQADLGPGAGGIPGGPRVPPNQRGFLQKQRMMNRPPANVGGGVNRVGQQDQQGGLARALQRGTGRPPMSRRSGFPGTR